MCVCVWGGGPGGAQWLPCSTQERCPVGRRGGVPPHAHARRGCRCVQMPPHRNGWIPSRRAPVRTIRCGLISHARPRPSAGAAAVQTWRGGRGEGSRARTAGLRAGYGAGGPSPRREDCPPSEPPAVRRASGEDGGLTPLAFSRSRVGFCETVDKKEKEERVRGMKQLNCTTHGCRELCVGQSDCVHPARYGSN